MNWHEKHVFVQSKTAIYIVCECSKPFLDPVHIPAIRKVTGDIKPNVIK